MKRECIRNGLIELLNTNENDEEVMKAIDNFFIYKAHDEDDLNLVIAIIYGYEDKLKTLVSLYDFKDNRLKASKLLDYIHDVMITIKAIPFYDTPF